MKLLLLSTLLLCSCTSTPTIEDAINAAIVIKVAQEYNLVYYYSKTQLIKYDEPYYIYYTDYIAVDDYHTYYSFQYLTAVENKEIVQIVEISK